MLLQPGKEKIAIRARAWLLHVERSINRLVGGIGDPRMVVGGCGLVGLSLALLFIPLLGSSAAGSIRGVGAISSPHVLQPASRALGGMSALEVIEDVRRRQAFLDSVDRLGMQRMKEIYFLHTIKSCTHE